MATARFFIVVLLVAAATAVAQTMNPPSNSQSSSSPAGGQGSSQQTPPPQASITNPKGKHPPTAKTKPEYDAYLAAVNTADPAQAETLAREFEVQFPKSELLPFLFQQLMGKYQKADNSDKTLDMGRKVLQYDPDNVGALVMVATVLAERTRQTDIDRDQRLKEATGDAQHALDDLRDGNYMLSANATGEQVQQFKDQVTGMAYQAMGKAEMERENYTAAEQDLRKATETSAGKGDAIVWYRLALALDRENRYPDANAAITTAVALAPADSAVANMAKNEQTRLKQLAAAGSNPAPASNQPQPEAVPSK
jgi:tetratricopeptide (TPR) repeat protein